MKSIILLVLSIVTLISCDKMEDNYKGYLEDGEILYTPKPLTIIAKPGNNRIQFDWEITSNNKVEQWVVSYGDESVSFQNDDKVSVHKQYIVGNVVEGNYEFSITSKSKGGNISLSTVINAPVFGEEFRKSLSYRPVRTFSIEGVNALINFKRASNLTRLTKIKYTNTQNKEILLTLKKDSTRIKLLDLSVNYPIQLQTFYRPTKTSLEDEETSIDEFASDWGVFVLPVQ